MNQISLSEYYERIEEAIEQGRHDEAIAHGRHILEQYPKNVGAYWLLGRAMLQLERNEQAVDMFQRVLSADPEHMLAWVGIGQVAKRRGELESAIWYFQRAFELATDNEMVARELRQLYRQVEGRERDRLRLTQGALAKLYLKGDLLSRAIGELRSLLEKHPDRIDLKVALAEALWHSEERVEASELCLEILEEQPYNLKANLILGEAWTRSGSAEGDLYLERAEAVDPENRIAQELFGPESPLPREDPKITVLTDEEITEVGRQVAEAALEEPLPDHEAPEPEPAEAIAAKRGIPAWLEEIGAGTPRPATAPLEGPEQDQPGAPPERPAPARQVAPDDTPMGGIPASPGEGEDEEALCSELAEEPELRDQPAGVPSRLHEVGAEEGEEPAGPDDLEPAEIPEWLLGLAPPQPPPAAPLEDLAAIFEEEPPEEGVPAIEKPTEVSGLPPWMEKEEITSEEDALAWLERLAQGEEELPAWPEAAQAPVPEMPEEAGPPPREAAIEGVRLGGAEEPAEAPTAEDLAPPTEELKPEEAAAVEEPAEKRPVWQAIEELPSAATALSWLRRLGRAAADEEAEEVEAEPLPEEEEAFGWTAFGEIDEAVPDWEEAPEPEEIPAEVVEVVAEVPDFEPPEAVEEPVEELKVAPEEEAPAPEEIPAEAVEVAPEVPEFEPPEAMEEPVEELEVVPEEAPKPEEIPAEVAEVAPEVPEFEPPEAMEEPVEELEEAPVEEIVEPGVVSADEDIGTYIAAQRTLVEEQPQDYAAWLELGRLQWEADRRDQAIGTYEHLIINNALLEEVIPDLEACAEEWPDVSLKQALGDAYMAADRLEEALNVYRQALASL